MNVLNFVGRWVGILLSIKANSISFNVHSSSRKLRNFLVWYKMYDVHYTRVAKWASIGTFVVAPPGGSRRVPRLGNNNTSPPRVPRHGRRLAAISWNLAMICAISRCAMCIFRALVICNHQRSSFYTIRTEA